MERSDLDILVIAEVDETRPNARYLTNVSPIPGRPLWVVFTREGSPIALGFGDPGEQVPWAKLVPTAPSMMLDALQDVLHRHTRPVRRLGLVGVGAESRAVTFGTPYAVAASILSWFPGAELVDVEPALRQLRAHKSSEELSLLRVGVAMLDDAFAEMEGLAAPGMHSLDLWAAGIGTLCRLGSEFPSNGRWAAAARPRVPSRPGPGILVPGHVVSLELEARANGYSVRATDAVTIRRRSATIVAIYERLSELWEAARARIAPGVSVDDLQRDLSSRSRRFAKPRGHLRQSFEEGWVFGLTISLRAVVDGRSYLAAWQDVVAIGEASAMQLGSRQPGQLAVKDETD
jgi:Xaa-Pro aminopeptidase